MAATPLRTAPVALADVHLARIAETGSARHPHRQALAVPHAPELSRNLADLVHLLCQLHGRYPGLIDLVLSNPAVPESARPWLRAAADAMEAERAHLVRLTAAVGPLPSTPGASQAEAGLLAIRHAMETLAASERSGCALGAATALIADWWQVRPLLERVADRHGLALPDAILPDLVSLRALVGNEVEGKLAAERGLAFGAEQMLLQHRGLFDLLDARASARDKA